MAKGKLFQYAVLFHPKATKEQAERNESPKSEVLTDITTILAGDEQQVGMLAARSLDASYLDKLDQVEVLVRPF